MIDSLAQKYIQDPDSIPSEYIEAGYEFVDEYCQKNNLDLPTFVKDTQNAPQISAAVHGALNWGMRMLIKKDEIQRMIENKHDWIVKKFTELHNIKHHITPVVESVAPQDTKSEAESKPAKKVAAKKVAVKEKEAAPVKKTVKPKK